MTDTATLQPSLFDVQRGDAYPPYRRASRTSKAAARKVAPTLSRRVRQVLGGFAGVVDATADEMAAMLGLDTRCVAPRVTQLATKALLTVTGDERKTRLGSNAAVYRISTNGREYLRQDVGHSGHGNTVSGNGAAS